MISLADVLELHQKSIADFGGSHGVRVEGLLEAAIARPFQTFSGMTCTPPLLKKQQH